jgi:hypothetical protein
MSDSRIKQNDAQENLLLLNRILITYKSALAEWYKGNPYEYLTLYSQDDYTYFDPVHEKRIEGYEEIKNFYDEIKGQVSCNDYEIRNPRIQKGKDIAVLTFNLYANVNGRVMTWNCTEVLRFANEKDWNIIHSHWAYALPAELLKTGDTNII